jgi:AAA family ATP:ADP antiporter
MTDRPTFASRLLQAASQIAPHEQRATFTSFAFVLILMSAWYILRPVRDAMASDWSDADVSWLWTLTFFCSALAVSLYGAAASRLRFKLLVPSVYGFFALSFVLVYIGTQSIENRGWLDKSFYVWVSVFSLFHISVFWSFMSELYAREQAKRLFGFIGAGASIGALIGPTLPALFASELGTDNLLLVATALLLFTLPLVTSLQRLNPRDGEPQALPESQAIGGNPLAGFAEFLREPFLMAIGLFIFFYTAIGSFVYFELKNLLADYDRAARAEIWAMMDLVVNTLTILLAAFATGRLATRFGLSITLASVPAVIGGGLLLLAAAPLVGIVVAVQIARRAGNYAITRPAREMLFTSVDRETRFKTKPVIDIVIYRGGDMLNAWAFTALTQGLGLGLAAVAAVGAGVAALWAALGIYLGREFRRRETTTQ